MSSPSQPPPDSQANPTLDSIVPAPQDQSNRGLIFLDLEIKATELEKQRLLNKELGENITKRADWARHVLKLLIGWLVAVIAVLLCQGFSIRGFHLDSSIVIAFIGTTTANVLALGYIVANYLFPKP